MLAVPLGRVILGILAAIGIGSALENTGVALVRTLCSAVLQLSGTAFAANNDVVH